MFVVEGGKLTYCWAKGLREMKPITFGSLKAEGNNTNTELGYGGGRGRTYFGCLRLRKGKLIYCWAIGLKETKPIDFGSHEAEGNETNTALGY